MYKEEAWALAARRLVLRASPAHSTKTPCSFYAYTPHPFDYPLILGGAVDELVLWAEQAAAGLIACQSAKAKSWA